jgi:hypothetical protein
MHYWQTPSSLIKHHCSTSVEAPSYALPSVSHMMPCKDHVVMGLMYDVVPSCGAPQTFCRGELYQSIEEYAGSEARRSVLHCWACYSSHTCDDL